jgi:hypothetical protein
MPTTFYPHVGVSLGVIYRKSLSLLHQGIEEKEKWGGGGLDSVFFACSSK